MSKNRGQGDVRITGEAPSAGGQRGLAEELTLNLDLKHAMQVMVSSSGKIFPTLPKPVPQLSLKD